VRQVQQLSGTEVEVIHVVGGGSRNALLCQLTADACGLPVVAGPVEATALGNVLVQARTLGAVGGGLAELRGLLRDTHRLSRYEPRGEERAWAAAEARLGTLSRGG
jgi:rhamnulokinase